MSQGTKYHVDRVVTNEQLKALGINVFEQHKKAMADELRKEMGRSDIKIFYNWRIITTKDQRTQLIVSASSIVYEDKVVPINGNPGEASAG